MLGWWTRWCACTKRHDKSYLFFAQKCATWRFVGAGLVVSSWKTARKLAYSEGRCWGYTKNLTKNPARRLNMVEHITVQSSTVEGNWWYQKLAPYVCLFTDIYMIICLYSDFVCTLRAALEALHFDVPHRRRERTVSTLLKKIMLPPFEVSATLSGLNSEIVLSYWAFSSWLILRDPQTFVSCPSAIGVWRNSHSVRAPHPCNLVWF